MRSTITGFAAAACAALALACGGRDQAGGDVNPPATVTPGETAGTSGTEEQMVTLSGCVVKAEPDGFVLTSTDEALVRQERGTAGHHRDDDDTAPAEPNRGAEDERLRHAQNPSAELGRYRLEGDAERIALHVDREVEITGRLQRSDAENSTPAVVRIETIDATGPGCDDRGRQ